MLTYILLHRLIELHLIMAAAHLFNWLCYFLITFSFSLSQRGCIWAMYFVFIFCECVVVVNEKFEGFLKLWRVNINCHVKKSRLFFLRALLNLKYKLGRPRLEQVVFQKTNDLVEFDSIIAVENILELWVKYDEASIFRVLKPILLYVLPESSYYFCPCFFLDT